MISAIRLLNFQAHEKRIIKFDPHVTTIVGRTDAGKSSIIRALVWAMTNKPGGIEFIRHKAKQVEVDLKVDGQQIKRIRGKTENAYYLDNKEFKAFGQDVPPEISALLKVSDVNIQQQHEAVFWFSLSAPEVSRQLNEIVNLGVIDRCMSGVATLIRESRMRVTVSEERLEKQQIEKARLNFVPEIDKDLKQLEAAGAELEEVSKRKERLVLLIHLCKQRAELIAFKQEQVTELQGVLECADTLYTLFRKRSNLQRRVDAIVKIECDYNQTKITADRLTMHYNKQFKGKVCPLCHGKGHL
jgi:DNA repair ATPase RecN